MENERKPHTRKELRKLGFRYILPKPQFHFAPNGEPVGIRTQGLLIKSQLLYQLSYGLGKTGLGELISLFPCFVKGFFMKNRSKNLFIVKKCYINIVFIQKAMKLALIEAHR